MLDVRRFIRLPLAGALFVIAGSALPQTQTLTDTFQVRINIQGTCLVLTSTDVDFGTHVPSAGSHSQTGTIRVQCTKDLPFSVGLDGGTTNADVNARAMVNGTGVKIPYTLRRNSPTGPIWGNDSSNWQTGVGQGLGSAYEISLTVYAQATLTGNEPSGAYSDTVTATLTY
ncbi:spore coat protein U [Pandoraea vervacti]|uniref:Spore coat protein U n=1 Tax=Pandoraea vervacti TaxID=656178 RepID=A0ABN4FX36_9BURK|nr:spore coat protein U [Pandoraea vervacti]